VCVSVSVRTLTSERNQIKSSFFENRLNGQTSMAITKSSTTIGAGPTMSATPRKLFHTLPLNAASTKFSYATSRGLETLGQIPRSIHITRRAMGKGTWVRPAWTNSSGRIGAMRFAHTSSYPYAANRRACRKLRQARVMRIKEQLCNMHHPLGTTRKQPTRKQEPDTKRAFAMSAGSQ
jgi:hypothetical protein